MPCLYKIAHSANYLPTKVFKEGVAWYGLSPLCFGRTQNRETVKTCCRPSLPDSAIKRKAWKQKLESGIYRNSKGVLA